MGFAEELYRLRKEAGLSQKELADKIGVAQASINYWEKNQRTPSISMVTLLADYFHISLESLLTGTEQTQLAEYERKQREEAAKNAPKFTDKPMSKKGSKVANKISNFFTKNEEGNNSYADTAPKFTDKGMSREEAQARYEIEVLFNTILDEGNLDSLREKNIAQLHEILTSYSNLNEIGRELAVVKIKELGYSSATTDSQLDDIYFKRVMKKVSNGEELTQAEIEWRYTYLDKSLKRIGDDFEAFYSMLNRTGREIAWTKINHAIEEIELLTKIPKFQTKPDEPPQE